MAEPGRTAEADAAPPAGLAVVAIAAMVAVFALLIFVPAGRLDWTPGWLYLGLVAVHSSVAWVCLSRWNPSLIARRMRLGAGTRTWDKIWSAVFAPVTIAVYVVAGLEARTGTSSGSLPLWSIGLAVFVCGAALFTRSMVENPFFEKTVRIQSDRGHRVIDTGPYAWVRHPGYVGFTGWLVSAPLLLGSHRAWVPALLAVLGIVIRTALEDRTLRAELPGYADYTERVRFRLIPGVW